jgi:hypothetical protein
MKIARWIIALTGLVVVLVCASVLLANIEQKIDQSRQKQAQKFMALAKRARSSFSPDRKLRELKAAQQAIRRELIQRIKTEFNAKILQHATSLCPHPVIDSASPAEVYPGFPVQITGCGFGSSKGMVTIPPLNIQAEVEKWSDSCIEGKIPTSITGFADPKTINFKVVTLQGDQSQVSANVVLKPNIEIVAIPHQVTAQDVSKHDICTQIWGECCSYLGQGTTPTWFEVSHAAFFYGCQGIDTILQGKQLNNNWVFHYFALNAECYNLPAPVDLSQPLLRVSCNISSASPNQNLNNWIGKSTIPKIEVSWKVGDPSVQDGISQLIYSGTIYIAGPAGTNYQ